MAKIAHRCYLPVRVGFFRWGFPDIVRDRVMVTFPCELRYESWSQKTRVDPDKGAKAWITVLPTVQTLCLLLPRKRSPDDATSDCCHIHLLAAYYSLIDRERMEGWVGLVGWPTADGLAAGRAQNQESSPVKDQRSTAVPRTANHGLRIVKCTRLLCSFISTWYAGFTEQTSVLAVPKSSSSTAEREKNWF